ncbi:MAG: hypothetical protein KDA27_18750 [Candidatus Eisenbacteria bacterium]|uniref:FlgD/Vpr Ig-like domain-containing protein n=1 Tax=Eiseniibacteriota bacterium TaxID=2212470 RepID=A0A956SGW5_UNCEI|nr:hypothetical protein [Candidatus Eisenbacteria bacterium]
MRRLQLRPTGLFFWFAWTGILSATAFRPASAATGDHDNLDLDSRWAWGPCEAVAADGDVAYFGDGAIVRVVDFSGASPLQLGSIVLPGPIRGMDLADGFLYVADHEDGLRVIDVSDPANPVETGAAILPTPAEDVAVVGTLACVAAGAHGLSVIDVSNPAAPFEVGFYDPGLDFEDVAASGTHAYVTGPYYDVYVVDISNPVNPVYSGVWDAATFGRDLVADGDRVFSAQDQFINVLDVSDPTNPTRIRGIVLATGRRAVGITVEQDMVYVSIAVGSKDGALAAYEWDEALHTLTQVGEVTSHGTPDGVDVAGGRVFLEDNYQGLTAFDVSTPSAPVETGRWDTAGRTLGTTIHGDLILATDFGGGLHVLDATTNPPVRIGHVELPGEPVQVVAQGDYAYVGARTAGVLIVDISDPSAPVQVGAYDTGNWTEGVRVAGDIVYAADGYGGLHIFDVSDPSTPVLLSLTPMEPLFQLELAGNLVYCALEANGIRVIDVSDPAAPVQVGSYSFGDPLAHATALAVSGDYLYVTDKEGPTLHVLNVSDPSAIWAVGGVPVMIEARLVVVDGLDAYVTAGLGGVRRFDLTDPTNPVDVGYFDTGHDGVSLAVDGSRIVVADNWDGLWILTNGVAASVTPGGPDALSSLGLAASPNPVQSATRLSFQLEHPAATKVTIHDASGRTIRTLLDGRLLPAGGHEATWDGRGDDGRAMPSGVYLGRVSVAGSTSAAERLVLVR